MKVQVTGKVKSRLSHAASNGKTYYSIVVLEDGAMFERPFEFSTEDASILGQSDGPFGVGKHVTAFGYANGYSSEYTGKDGKKHLAYNIRLRLQRLDSVNDAEQEKAPSVEEGQGCSVEDVI